MAENFFHFTKADRRVMLWLLAAGLLAVVSLAVFWPAEEEDAANRIEVPAHWWEKQQK